MAASLAQGKFELEKSENFDEYMKTIGVGLPQRLVGNNAKPQVQITITDGVWTITTSSALSKVEIKFKIGEEFDETTADGRKVKSTFTVDGNKLIQEQIGKINSHLVREFSQDGFVLTLKAEGVVSTRQYKRIQ
jgi:fatty acid-binding protein 3